MWSLLPPLPLLLLLWVWLLALVEAPSTWKSGYSRCAALPATLLLLVLSALLLLLLLVVAWCAALAQPAGSRLLLNR
jgi:hypothetical protein